MKISEIKKKMLNWKDFWGGDIIYENDIKSAKTKKELAEVMDRYYRHLEDCAKDAQAHCENFKRELGLDNF